MRIYFSKINSAGQETKLLSFSIVPRDTSGSSRFSLQQSPQKFNWEFMYHFIQKNHILLQVSSSLSIVILHFLGIYACQLYFEDNVWEVTI